MLGIAQERKFGTYGTGTISSPILMTDLINGGGSNSFPALNTSSTSKPNTTTPHSMSEWYSYDQDSAQWRSFTVYDYAYGDGGEACTNESADNLTLYYDDGSSGTGAACPSATGVTIYTTSALTTAFNGGGEFRHSTQCSQSYNIQSDGLLEGIHDC